jgi:chemotaxis protein MotA
MDFTTLVGLLITFGMMFLGLVAQIGNLEQIKYFVDPGSILVVLGGTFGSTVMSMPLKNIVQAGGVLRVAFLEKRRDVSRLVRSIVSLSETARRDGILALEPLISQVDDSFLARGLQMAVDGNDPEAITGTMRNELDQMHARHQSGKALLEFVARYAPAYGMLGTLIGLILMLSPSARQGGSPDQVVPLGGMALALVTTFYGVLLANAVALPLADKLAERDQEETVYMETIITGIRSIQSGDNPKVVELKLGSFLPPHLRA